MPCVHEFGIMDNFDFEKNYSEYNPKKYNCISIEDDIVQDLQEELFQMKTYFHSFQRPERGLTHYGVTIIPPESLPLFYEVIVSSRVLKKSNSLTHLTELLDQAMVKKKYVIHYGI